MLIKKSMQLLCQKLVCNQYGFFVSHLFDVASATSAIFIILARHSGTPACGRPVWRYLEKDNENRI